MKIAHGSEAKYYWLVYELEDQHNHFCCYIRRVSEYENISSIIKNLPGLVFANVILTKKAAFTWADYMNREHRKNNRYIYDFMDDGTTPAPF